MKQEELYTQLAAKTPEQPVKNNSQFPTGITDAGMDEYLAGADISLTKEQAQKILRYGQQLGLDLLAGSSLAEAFGFRPDIIGGKGYTPSYPELVKETEQLYKEGKKAEALGKGIETGLVGVGAVGEGMMLAGALTGPLAPLVIGSGLALKGISKAGKLILESKTGIKVLANFTGNKNSPNIQNIEIPKNVSPDSDLEKIINNPEIPTTITDDIDTVDYIPDNLKSLNAEEAITTYITMPEKITRNQLIKHPAISGRDNVNPNIVLDFDAAADKTNTYLKEKGFDEGSNVSVYRLIKYKVKKDSKGNIIGRENYQDSETLISGSLTPEANLKTLDFFTQSDIAGSKMGMDDMYEIVKYNVPQDKIKLAMGAYKNNITSSINKQLKNKNIIAEPEKGFKKVNPAEDAKKLIDMQDEVIADVSGLEKIKLGSFKDYQDLKNQHVDKIIFNKIKNIDDYKNQMKKDLDDGRILNLTRDEIFRSGKSENELLEMNTERAMPFLDKVTRFYNKAYVTDRPAETLQISQNPTFSRLEDAVNNLKQKKGSGEVFLNRLKGQAKQEELDWTGLTKFLKDKKEVTKEQIQSYMKQNSIPIEERIYSYNPRDPGWKNNPQYGQYTIDGDDRTNLKNYKEFVFSIPQKWRERNLEYPLTNKEEVRLAELKRIGDKYRSYTPKGLTIEGSALTNKLENYERKNKPLEFFPSHNYDKDVNLISRVRVKDRIDGDGNPTVHMEEIQSELVADTLKAKKQAEKDADSFYISSEDKTLLPGITKQDVELLRKGYAPEGIKFRKKKTMEELMKTNNAISIRTKELQKKHNIDLDKVNDKIKDLRQDERYVENLIENYITRGGDPNKINPLEKQNLIDIRKEIDENRKFLNDFDNIYKNDKVLNRLYNKSKRLSNRNRLNTLLRDLPPEFPVLSIGKKDDWYKLPIDRMIRYAAERDMPNVTLTKGEVQYDRYAQTKGQYNLQRDKLEARDTLFKDFDSFLKDVENIEFPKRSKDDLDYSENRYIMENNPDYLPMLSLANKEKLDKILSKYKLYKLSAPALQRILKSVQVKTDKAVFNKTKKDKENIKRLINDALMIHKSAKVGRNYDTKYVGYLDDIAKKYNAKRDTTFVDNNMKDGASYRLEITPQMKKDYLKKGAARFKTGGYIKERL